MTVIKLLWIAHNIISKIKFKSKFVKYTNQAGANKGQPDSGKAQEGSRSTTFPSGRSLTKKKEPKKTNI